MIFQLGLVGDGFAVFAHIGEGSGEQIGVSLLPETEDHRSAGIEGVSSASKGSATSPWNQIALQNKSASPFGSQLTCGYKTTDTRADHHGIPLLLIAHGFGSIGGDASGPSAVDDQADELVGSR